MVIYGYVGLYIVMHEYVWLCMAMESYMKVTGGSLGCALG